MKPEKKWTFYGLVEAASWRLPLFLRKKFMDPVYGRFVFSKFDKAQFDGQGWKYVVPEIVSKNFARNYQNKKILDAYAGLGGSSIQLALAGNNVTAAEIDNKRFACMKRNMEIYGVADGVNLWQGDVEKILKERPEQFDLICVDPPWKDLRANGFGRYLEIYFQYAPLPVFKVSKLIENEFIFAAGAQEIREIFVNHTLFHKEAFFYKNGNNQKTVKQEYLSAPEVTYVFP